MKNLRNGSFELWSKRTGKKIIEWFLLVNQPQQAIFKTPLTI